VQYHCLFNMHGNGFTLPSHLDAKTGALDDVPCLRPEFSVINKLATLEFTSCIVWENLIPTARPIVVKGVAYRKRPSFRSVVPNWMPQPVPACCCICDLIDSSTEIWSHSQGQFRILDHQL